MARWFRGSVLIVPLCAVVICARAGEDSTKKETKAHPIRAAALGLEGSIRFPDGWTREIAKPGSSLDLGDPRANEQIEKQQALPNTDFEMQLGWTNTGEILARVYLKLGRKDFQGTAKQLASRSVSEIRAKWPAFRRTKPVYRSIKLASGPALYVALENPREPPYRVHFVTLIVEGVGCGLYCYGWGPQANIVDLSGGRGVPANAKRFAEQARRLSRKKLAVQKSLFQVFAKEIVPTLKLGKPRSVEPDDKKRKPKR